MKKKNNNGIEIKKNNKTNKQEIINNESKKKRSKAFTLIELLAVIIILGILMIIAIPSVTTYISNSRKSSYIDTAKNIIDGARNKVNEGKLDVYNPTVTYYLPGSCINTENSFKSPYGEFTEAYVGVTFNGDNYNYYWISTDTAEMGIKTLTSYDKLTEENVEPGVKDTDIKLDVGVDGRETIIVFNKDCTEKSEQIAFSFVDSETGEQNQGKTATFITGNEITVKMKRMAANNNSLNGREIDTNITAFRKSNVEPSEENKGENNIVSTSDSDYPIYIWYDSGTIYWWSEDNTPSLNEDAGYMFYLMTRLTDVSGVSSFDTSKVTDLTSFFEGNTLIQDLSPIKNWNVSNVKYMDWLFYGCLNVEEIDLSNWSTPSLTYMAGMFGMWDINDQMTSNSKLKRIKFSNKFDTSKVTDMYGLFGNALHIEDFSFLRNFNTSNVIYMDKIFQNSLSNLDYIRNWNTSKVESMYQMFAYNDRLTEVSSLNWDTSNVKNMNGLFTNCKNLTTVDLSNWDTSSLENMGDFLAVSDNVVNINLSGWNTSNVTKMSYAFNGLYHIEELDISSFDTRKVTSFKRMFNNSTNLRHIYVGNNWDTSKNTDETRLVFPESSNLPNFNRNNSNYRDLSYAHTGQGGYLTLKSN